MSYFIAGFEKRADEYFHRTNNIDPILSSGKILAIGHLAKLHPEEVVEVEPNRWSRDRTSLSAMEAAKKMEGTKDTKSIFLTKGKPIGGDSYGKYIIKKELAKPKESNIINLIPEEYIYRKPISVKRKTTVYAPVNEITELQDRYKGYNFKSNEEITDYLPSHSISALSGKLKNRLFEKTSDTLDYSSSKYLKQISTKAQVSGSTALGINIPGSDVDIFVPFKRKSDFEKAKKRIQDKLKLTPSPYNKPTSPKFVFATPEVDVALAYGPEAMKRHESVEKAKQILTPEMAEQIRKKKIALKKAWFFPEKRYKKYKKDVDNQLGLYRLK